MYQIFCIVWQDECSFVSLRDVERAMLVFVYFFEKMDLFRDAMNKKERKEKEVKHDERRISIPVSSSRDLVTYCLNVSASFSPLWNRFQMFLRILTLHSLQLLVLQPQIQLET